MPDSNRECTFDPLERTFVVPEINAFDLLRGTQFRIELKGFANSEYAKPSDTFSITTKTGEGYLIDYADEGLFVNAKCDWPCMDCTLEDPSECR